MPVRYQSFYVAEIAPAERPESAHHVRPREFAHALASAHMAAKAAGHQLAYVARIENAQDPTGSALPKQGIDQVLIEVASYPAKAEESLTAR